MSAVADARAPAAGGAEVTVSFVLPARNEAAGLALVLPELRRRFPQAEILVVDDGSTDDTAAVATAHGATVIAHPYSMGNGAAIKSGARAAAGEVLVLMDADGQHRAEDVGALLAMLEHGHDMVVGARSASTQQASRGRWLANNVYNRLAGWMVGHRIPDLTSGFRVARASRFKRFLYMLPNGFSYPTTITMGFFRAGYTVAYVPVDVRQRVGQSHIRLLHDGVRFFLIIFRVGTLFSPLKLFLPISVVFLALGLVNYGYSYLTSGRFTNMSALLLITSVLVFLIGLVSEQITNLMYMRTNDDD
ncbi:MAG: glycosyltransferase family 2 protein [Gammaproteobacteria bacterium]|nr:glycosyltransferase family 2 protein [Gammaproteobacteria bacterium]